MSRPYNYKTVLCDYFKHSGWCKRGSHCTFAHGEAELQSFSGGLIENVEAPLQRPKGAPANYKTMLCTRWEGKGRCHLGSNCPFAHGQAELQQFRRQSFGASSVASSSSNSNPAEEAMLKSELVRTANGYECTICGLHLTGPGNWDEHVRGKFHQSKMNIPSITAEISGIPARKEPTGDLTGGVYKYLKATGNRLATVYEGRIDRSSIGALALCAEVEKDDLEARLVPMTESDVLKALGCLSSNVDEESRKLAASQVRSHNPVCSVANAAKTSAEAGKQLRSGPQSDQSGHIVTPLPELPNSKPLQHQARLVSGSEVFGESDRKGGGQRHDVADDLLGRAQLPGDLYC